MNKNETLTAILAPYSPQKLDYSRRGTGLNAVWKIKLNGQQAILKTYSARRGPLQTASSVISHMLSGRTPYTAFARCRTERENLVLWKKSGFDVPELFKHTFTPALPVHYLCMEYAEGPSLSAYLLDPKVTPDRKDSAFIGFLAQWGKRHDSAEQLCNPRLIQEHATFDHVMLSGSRFVTFDLEVSYTKPGNIRRLIAYEICGYLRSIFKKMPEDQILHFMDLLIKHYPNRFLLENIYPELWENQNALTSFIQTLDRTVSKRDQKMNRYEIARKLKDKLDKNG